METQKAIEHLKGILPNTMTRLETREAIETVLKDFAKLRATVEHYADIENWGNWEGGTGDTEPSIVWCGDGDVGYEKAQAVLDTIK